MQAPSPFIGALGARPPRLAGRHVQLDALGTALDALAAGRAARPQIWLGRLGTGRSALAHEAARRAARRGWAVAVVSVEAGGRLEHDLARGVAAALLRLQRRLPGEGRLAELLGVARAYAGQHLLELPVEGPAAEVSWPGTTLADAGALLERVADALGSIGSGCLLAFDDLDLADRSTVADVLSAGALLAGAAKPVVICATGLPGTIPLTGCEMSRIGALDPPAVLDALAGPAVELGVVVGRDTVAAIGRRTGGYPLYVQSFAAHAWRWLDGPALLPAHVDAGASGAEAELRAQVFEPALAGCDDAGRAVCHVLAGMGGRATWDRIVEAAAQQVGRDDLEGTRDALLAGRVLVTDDDGQLAFAIPYLERYLTALERTGPK